MVLGLVASVVLAHGSLLKAIGMIVLGLLLGLVGADVETGLHRFTLRFPELAEGISFVLVAMGMFGLGEIIKNLEDEHNRTVLVRKVTGLMPTKEDLKKIIAPILRGTALGSALGILPGGGAMLSSFAAYSLEKKISRTPQRFGKGAIEGVAAPESANNAGAQTSFIPMLTLGIPSNPVMALMIGAMIIQGIKPGPSVMTEQPALFWGIIVSMWIGNLFLVILNLPMIGLWVKLLTIPYHLLFPIILVFSAIGVFSVNNSGFDVYLMALFGVLGYALSKLECEPAPLLLGFILGPMMEENMRRALVLVARRLHRFRDAADQRLDAVHRRGRPGRGAVAGDPQEARGGIPGGRLSRRLRLGAASNFVKCPAPKAERARPFGRRRSGRYPVLPRFSTTLLMPAAPGAA